MVLVHKSSVKVADTCQDEHFVDHDSSGRSVPHQRQVRAHVVPWEVIV